jgi:hypothetical protein
METVDRLMTAAQCILDGFITLHCLHGSKRHKKMTTVSIRESFVRAQYGAP